MLAHDLRAWHSYRLAERGLLPPFVVAYYGQRQQQTAFSLTCATEPDSGIAIT